MSYQEKRKIMEILTGAAVLVAYCLYAVGKYRNGAIAPDDYRGWAIAMLIFIGIGAGVTIVSQILFHIGLSIGIAVKEKINDRECDDTNIERTINAEMIEDERDKLISLKSQKIVFMFTGFGFILALLSLVLRYPPVVMMHILFGAFSLGNLIDGCIQLYFYRAGIRNV